ncbi:MAG: sulfite reductase subunit beta [Acidocella sp. 20-57-95]|nr:MAG: sulfite reductase subunit beta [Acidocella sp. 20-57-95]OYV61863.1 MAG: sulfite reductase subunit beta [Acidocella sp. 21-58-7]HQT63615.1 NADPH-dependent assimilatory sulfite reductase hemoprotein subunit [Acidocella sp.]HQU04191.1 NADPH-dependent assimilatory sulfite reductase hemoprotein subunit [Acidocella sp.]
MTETIKLAHNETIKTNSRYLRGTLAEGLAEVATGAISDDDQQLIKFHGIYLQDDRDLRAERAKRKLDKAYSFMARLRVPGGVLSSAQYLAMDKLADERGNHTLRLTTRQSIQFHGVIKTNLRPALRQIDSVLLDTIAACGDVNRNVMCTPNEFFSPVYATAEKTARDISNHLLPHSNAWREIFIDGEPVTREPENEPIYGLTYLPRKFKIAIAVPPQNDTDVFAHDLSYIAIVENDELIGYNVVVGGGMGATHGDDQTYPLVGHVIGFCTVENAPLVAEAVVTTQRDYGNRSNRRRARLKYTIEDRGLEWFAGEVNKRLATKLTQARPYKFTGNGDRMGWHTGADGRHHLTLFVENGRVADVGDWRLKSALKQIAQSHDVSFIITPNQNLIIARATDAARQDIESVLKSHNVPLRASTLRESAMACVALPTCSLALTESERYLPSLITKLEALVTENGLQDESITVRMTGCPNGCARPYIAEIGMVGRNPGKYNLYLGAAHDGSRVGKMVKEDADETTILTTLSPLLADYAKSRKASETFGDYCLRTVAA